MAVRIRPSNDGSGCLQLAGGGTVILREQAFKFDHLFDGASGQEDVREDDFRRFSVDRHSLAANSPRHRAGFRCRLQEGGSRRGAARDKRFAPHLRPGWLAPRPTPTSRLSRRAVLVPHGLAARLRATFTSGHLPPSCSDGQRENAYADRLRQLPDTAGHLAARRQRAGADHGELWRRVPVPGACGAAALQPSLPGQTAAPAATPAGRCPLRRRR